MKRQKTWRGSLGKLLALFSILSVIAGCAPSLPDYVEDYDLVYTKNNEGYNFSSVHTYFLPNRVAHVDSGGTVSHPYDAQILLKIKTNLDALGWTQLDPNGGTKADVVVLPASMYANNLSCAMYCWYCYWYGGYPGWGYYPPMPGYGWGYPSDMICSAYRTGSVYVTIVDPDLANATEKKLPIEWIGILNGLAEGSNISDRINTGIDQMFKQSPYLKP